MTKISNGSAKKEDRLQTVGRRKAAGARVRLVKGSGEITVNGEAVSKYFPYFEDQERVRAPLKAVAKDKDMDVTAKVNGGGKRGQAIAVQLGVARALVLWNEDWRKTMKTLNFLTRDARVKERKKPGLKRARRGPQWSKR
jgi:small subunit ribosomal protein S9